MTDKPKKTGLQGGCFILDPGVMKARALTPLITSENGAKHLSQYSLKVSDGPSDIYTFGDCDVILFSVSGKASVSISGKLYDLPPQSGLYVRPGEAFQITSDDKFKGLVTVCPEGDGMTLRDTMPDNFDAKFADRLVSINPAKKEAMGDRFFQVLVSKNVGSDQVTQFIGEIPRSKAPSHFHLYEEALYILSGEGFMWTENVKGAVKAGSIIFLPKKQQHSLECTSKEGLKVVGHFYPSGSPAENY